MLSWTGGLSGIIFNNQLILKFPSLRSSNLPPPEAPGVSPFIKSLLLASEVALLPDRGLWRGTSSQGYVFAESVTLGFVLSEPRLGTPPHAGCSGCWNEWWFAFQMVKHLNVATFIKGWCRQFCPPPQHSPQKPFSFSIVHYYLFPPLEALWGKNLEQLVHHWYLQCLAHNRYSVKFCALKKMNNGGIPDKSRFLSFGSHWQL